MDESELIDALIEREGGFVANPVDRGGPTRYGITEAVARAHGYAGDMAALPREPGVAPIQSRRAVLPRTKAAFTPGGERHWQ